MRSALPKLVDTWAWSAATIPIIGACSHFVPSSVVPFSAGKADSATIAIAT